MTEEINDMHSTEKNLSDPLDDHLREILSEQELVRFRKQIPPEFISDAEEGLNQFENADHLKPLVKHLIQDMHRQLLPTKKRSRKALLSNMSWTYWSIIIVLLIAVAGFLMVWNYLHHQGR